MTLSSKLHKQAGQVQYAVLDVTDNGKPFFVAIVTGDLHTNAMSDIGNACLHRLTQAQDQCSNTDEVLIVELRSPERARERIPQIGQRIGRHGAAALICLDAATYDAAFEALNVRG